MSFLLWQQHGPVGIAAGRRVLRAAEVPLLADANRLCGQLQALHADEAARIESACAEGRRSGYRAGFDEGLAAAAEEHAARLTALAAAAARDREALAAQVAGLALEVARKMVGGLAGGERLLALAATAVQEVLPEGPLTLLVHPERVPAVRERLAAYAAEGMATRLPPFDVRGDGELEIEGCRIESMFGSVDASLDTQLQRLAAAWGVAVPDATCNDSLEAA
jgi:flagellar biosynthesis/type III secretory pathway protein FliH